jgi:hypothetical protein
MHWLDNTESCDFQVFLNTGYKYFGFFFEFKTFEFNNLRTNFQFFQRRTRPLVENRLSTFAIALTCFSTSQKLFRASVERAELCSTRERSTLKLDSEMVPLVLLDTVSLFISPTMSACHQNWNFGRLIKPYLAATTTRPPLLSHFNHFYSLN